MDSYSRMVAIFKVILPLAALGLLSTVFLLSRNLNPTATIPFADHEIAERLRNKLITAPVFSGTSSHGDEISVTASQASPGGLGEPATARDLRAKMVSPGGLEITLSSENGTLDLTENRATFDGAVRIETTTGYVLETEKLHTALNNIDADSPGQVTGAAPIGHITAGNMTIRSENDDGNVHMLFNNGVKLVYAPKQPER